MSFRTINCHHCKADMHAATPSEAIVFCDDNCLHDWLLDNWETALPKKEDELAAIGFEEHRADMEVEAALDAGYEPEPLGGDSV